MKSLKYVVLAAVVVVTTGCASGLNSMQKREYAAFEHDGVLIEEKNPTLAAVLGLLPGFGSFYVREPGAGVANLLLWPVSVVWDPVSGYDGAMAINYDLTKHHLNKQKEAEISELDDKLATGDIENKAYILAKKKINEKYDYH